MATIISATTASHARTTARSRMGSLSGTGGLPAILAKNAPPGPRVTDRRSAEQACPRCGLWSNSKECNALPVKVRKFIGAVLLVVFVLFYALVAMTVGAARLPGTSILVQTLYYAVAGLIWVIPAGFIIKWMQRPDPGGK
jgi:hypothetical protein